MAYYAKERLDTGIVPGPVGVASRNQRFDISPTGSPLYRRGFLSANNPLGGCGCGGLGASGDTLDTALPWLLFAGVVVVGYLVFKK